MLRGEAADQLALAGGGAVHQTEEDVAAEQRILVHIDHDLRLLVRAGTTLRVHVLLQVHLVLVRLYEVKVAATEHLDVGGAALPLGLGDRSDLDLVQDLHGRRLDHPLEDPLEVVDVSNLAGLGDTTAMAELFPPIEGDGIHGIIGEATQHEEAGNARARATLPRITIDYHYIILVLREE